MVNRRYFFLINKKMIKGGPSSMNENPKVQAFNEHKNFTWGKKHKKTTPTYNCKWRSHVLEEKFYKLIYYIPNPNASLTHFLIVATYTNHPSPSPHHISPRHLYYSLICPCSHYIFHCHPCPHIIFILL
jgi:hypothetical protein